VVFSSCLFGIWYSFETLQTSSKYVSREENKEVRAKAAPFLKWLKEAEEESDGGGDEEDDGIEVHNRFDQKLETTFIRFIHPICQIVYGNQPSAVSVGKNGMVAPKPAETKDGDFDIDNI